MHFNTFNAFLLHVVEPDIVAPKSIANTCMDYLLARYLGKQKEDEVEVSGLEGDDEVLVGRLQKAEER